MKRSAMIRVLASSRVTAAAFDKLRVSTPLENTQARVKRACGCRVCSFHRIPGVGDNLKVPGMRPSTERALSNLYKVSLAKIRRPLIDKGTDALLGFC